MRRAIALVALAAAMPAAAHEGAAHEGAAHTAGWSLDPLITGPLLLTAMVYAVGLVRLRRRAARARRLIARQARIFLAGWLVLAGALVSPLHEGGEHSFTLHMIEHELLMLVAALLLVAGKPGAALLWGLLRPLRRLAAAAAGFSLWRRLTEPVTATAIQAIAIWVWHAPVLFDLALRHEVWHIAQHLSFILSALLFWWAILHRSSETLAALCLFATSMIGGALGALMAFSGSPWYHAYATMGVTPVGLSPVEDQQLAGLIMWIPGGLFHLIVALWFLARWLSHKEATHARTAS